IHSGTFYLPGLTIRSFDQNLGENNKFICLAGNEKYLALSGFRTKSIRLFQVDKNGFIELGAIPLRYSSTKNSIYNPENMVFTDNRLYLGKSFIDMETLREEPLEITNLKHFFMRNFSLNPKDSVLATVYKGGFTLANYFTHKNQVSYSSTNELFTCIVP